MGSSTSVLLISEAVVTNYLPAFFSKRFAKQMKERMSEFTMTQTQCHHRSANPPFANRRAEFKHLTLSKI
tara:strand:- start:168 stop:377 length:210 start_codon:yes stop_codon:yes gene_type:complete